MALFIELVIEESMEKDFVLPASITFAVVHPTDPLQNRILGNDHFFLIFQLF